jgi:hypothetical protein
MQRGVLVTTKNTKPITFGTAIEFITIIIVLFITVNLIGLVGAVAATAAFGLGRIMANIYLATPSIKAVKS